MYGKCILLKKVQTLAIESAAPLPWLPNKVVWLTELLSHVMD